MRLHPHGVVFEHESVTKLGSQHCTCNNLSIAFVFLLHLCPFNHSITYISLKSIHIFFPCIYSPKILKLHTQPSFIYIYIYIRIRQLRTFVEYNNEILVGLISCVFSFLKVIVNVVKIELNNSDGLKYCAEID